MNSAAVIVTMTERRIVYVYEPSWKIYALVAALIGVILVDRYISINTIHPPHHNITNQESARIPQRQEQHGALKDSSALMSLVIKDVAITSMGFAQDEINRRVYTLPTLLSGHTIDMFVISPHTRMWKSICSYPYNMQVQSRHGSPYSHNNPGQMFTTVVSSELYYGGREIDNGCLFRLPKYHQVGIIFTAKKRDYTIFLLDITKIRLYGKLTPMFYEWLEYYLEHRTATPMLEIELMTHDYDATQVGPLAEIFVTFTTGECVNGPGYVFSCEDLAGAKCDNYC